MGARLTNGKFKLTSFENADLTGADLTGADLTGALLSGGKLSGVIWSTTTCPDGTVTNTGC